MNQSQENRERFPGIEFQDVGYIVRGGDKANLHNRIFSTYQCESKLIESMKDTLSHIGKGRLVSMEIRYGEGWWNSSWYTNKDDAMGILFEASLARYVTRIGIAIYGDRSFSIQVKVHDLNPGMETNIGPDFVEYIGTLFDGKL